MDRQNRDREGDIWDRVRGWRKEVCGWDPVGEEITELGDG